MSVRPTQTKSGYPRRSRQPYPSAEPESEAEAGSTPVTEPGGPASPGPGQPEAGLAAEAQPSRAERRAARRMRRNLAVVCGLVVAVCLVLTILIVNMARTRPSGLDLPSHAVLSAEGPTPAPLPLSTIPISQTRDAPVSEGGNP
jgi:hypothetical protein